MSAWTVVPCLLALRAEFDRVNPGRDRGADGTIGDSAHTSTSDHSPDEDSDVLRDHDADSKNEVHALDIDSSGPWPAGRSFKSMVMDVIAGEKAKWLDADDMCRLNYVIIDREIYDKDTNFNPQPYTGSDPHTNHAHFSARYETQAENDTRPWGVVREEPMTPAELATALKDPAVQAALNTAMAYVVSNMGIYNQADGTNPHGTKKWADFIGSADGTAADLLRKQVTGLETKVDGLTELIESHVAGILEGMAKPPAAE